MNDRKFTNAKDAIKRKIKLTLKIGVQPVATFNLTDHDWSTQYDYDQRLLKVYGNPVAAPDVSIESVKIGVGG